MILATISNETTEALEPSVVDKVQQAVENPSVIKDWLASSIPEALNLCLAVILSILVFLIGRKIIRMIIRMMKKTMEKSSIDAGVASFLSSLTKYVLYFLLVMLILGSFGVTAGSIVAVLGSAGLTLGLALQGTLSNFAGGVLILVLRPFMVGDYIIDHGSGQEGTVTGISICYTKLTTVDNRVTMIPNGSLSNSTITNVSRNPERRVDLMIGVSYDANLSEVKRIFAELADKQETVLKDKPVMIFVSELAESSVNVGFRVWVKAEDYWTTKWELTEKIKNALDENHISIPFNQLDVHIDSN